MTDAEAPATPPEPEAPPPEPWTPAKVREWNHYYDIYVALFVLVLAFFASANKITASSVWTHLRSGEQVAAGVSPTTDSFSYTQPGSRWIHVPWLADLGHFEFFRLISGFAPAEPLTEGNPDLPEVSQARREQRRKSEQWGAAGLIALDAFFRALTVLLLLQVRHRGPGLWWSAVCVTLALAVMPTPLIVLNGGVAGPAGVGSISWGQLLLAVELLCLFRAFGQGKPRALYALIPGFLVWANVDESFFYGLLILAASTAGLAVVRGRKPRADEPAAPALRTALIVLGASAAACLINPSTFRVYPAAFSTYAPWAGWFTGPTTEAQLSLFFNTVNRPVGTAEETRKLQIYFVTLAAIGAFSFALNRRRLSIPRLFAFLAAVLLAVSVRRAETEFALLFAYVLVLNGQEWYQDAFGTEGRLGRGWAVWSIGGRAVTIGLISLAMYRIVTGTGLQEGEAPFGFGFDPDDFAFEAADFVGNAPFEGNVFNTTLKQGDSIVWRAYPGRKTFYDNRRNLFDASTVRKMEEARLALRDGEVNVSRPILDEYKVTAVMLDLDPSVPSAARKTYLKLLTDKDWIPIYDDGNSVIFGRADAPEKDLAYFRSHRLDAEEMAYKHPTPLPASDKLPTATSVLDRIYRFRSKARPQSHSMSASRWLRPMDLAPESQYLPDPARCFLAIAEARRALDRKPEDTVAYGVLAQAYSDLMVQESALIAGVKLGPENIATVASTPIQYGLLGDRLRQQITALNFAIVTTPPKEVLTRDETDRLFQLNSELARTFLAIGYIDLARDRFIEMLDLANPARFNAQAMAQLGQQVNQMTNQVTEIQTRINNMAIETQARPFDRAREAQRLGAVGLAIQLLEEALQGGDNPAQIKPTLLDLYCQVGQPDKALDLWTAGNAADPVLSDGPGTAAFRQGKVFLLVGNYGSALTLWIREALPQLKMQRSIRGPEAVRALLQGEPMTTARTLLELPEQVQTQGVWEFEAGMACLEAGASPEETATHLTNALKLEPALAVRPLIAYYLEKLGKPVPADPAATPKPADPPAATPPAAVPAPK